MSIDDALVTSINDYPPVELSGAGELQARVSKEMRLPLTTRIRSGIQKLREDASGSLEQLKEDSSESLQKLRGYVNNVTCSIQYWLERKRRFKSMNDLYERFLKEKHIYLGQKDMDALGIAPLCSSDGLATIHQHKTMLSRSGYRNPILQLPIANHSCRLEASLKRYNPMHPEQLKIEILSMERPKDYGMIELWPRQYTQ